MSERNDPELMKAIAQDLGLEELVADISKKIEKPAAAPELGDWIKLNVGGKMFETTRSTLVSAGDSLLGKMFDPTSRFSPPKFQDGAYLIDACPKSFGVILHWLRYRRLSLGEASLAWRRLELLPSTLV